MESIRVIISEFGTVLGKHSERLVVRSPRPPEIEGDEHPAQLRLPFAAQLELPLEKEPKKRNKDYVKTELAFLRISEIVITCPGVSISADLVEECCLRGIPITFLHGSGHPYAQLISPMLNATIQTRREQLRAYDDRRGLELTLRIIRAKMKNQAYLLKYFGKYLSEARPDSFEVVSRSAGQIEGLERALGKVQGTKVDDARTQILTLEAKGATTYWDSVREILSGKVPFEGREHRGASDPVNAALNYGYGILYSRVWASIANAGLEPYAGFLHVDRPGKPSMVLDLMEEFRQPCVDRAVLAYFNQGQQVKLEKGLLDLESRRAIAAKVAERLDTQETYHGRRLKVSSIIQAQARKVGAFLRGECSYESYTMRW